MNKIATSLKRYDNKKLVIGKNVFETAQGFLRIPAYTARTGIQKYKMDDGSVLKEYRPEEEVFSESSMNSLATAVVTNNHPKEMVNPDNAKELVVGYPTGGVEKVSEGMESYLKTDVVITHRSAIDAISKGKAELSNGYTVDLEYKNGEHNGEKYDAVQRNIVNNHIAIVWRGRAGEKVRLRLDSNDAILVTDNDSNEPNEGNKTMKIKIGDKDFEVSDECGSAYNTQMKKMKEDNEKSFNDMKEKKDHAEAMLEVETSKKSKLVAKVDSLESDLEKAKGAELPTEKMDEMVKERIAVLDSGKRLLSKEEVEKLDSMTNEEIKIAVIKVDSPKVDEEKLKSADYVNARYDHIVENFDEAEEKKKQISADIQRKREDSAKEDGADDKEETSNPNDVRRKMMQDSAEGNC